MTQDEIIEMARQAGFGEYVVSQDSRFEDFAKLVATKEREACAQIGDGFHDDEANCGDLIRARGSNE